MQARQSPVLFITHRQCAAQMGWDLQRFTHHDDKYVTSMCPLAQAQQYLQQFCQVVDQLNTDQPEWQDMEAGYLPLGWQPKYWFSDVDATLLDGECIDQLAMTANVSTKVRHMTTLAMEGKLPFHDAIVQRVALLQGLELEKVEQIAVQMSVMEGLPELLEYTQSHNTKLVMLSGGFKDMLLGWQKEWQAETVIANQLEWHQNTLTGKLRGDIICGQQKSHYARTILQAKQLRVDECLFTGDGANDIPMMQLGGVRLGMCPKKALRPYLNGMTFSGSHLFFKTMLHAAAQTSLSNT
ncbi:MAG: phosphoserine phosphatase SerB [Zetaproteobacteria bacterium]|nr:phosphoserine phosphatase SerB [Zetaproteobacteria bacterium]